MSRPVTHTKRWHGVIRPTLAAGGLWLATACGDSAAPAQELAVSTQAQAAHEESCSPESAPPAVTCDAEAVEECGRYTFMPSNFQVVNSCGGYEPSYPYPVPLGVGDHPISASIRDGSGRTASCTTLYHVRDTWAPEIDLSGPSELTLTVGSTYEERGGGYYDYCDHGSYYGGSLYQPTTGSVNTNALGTYVLSYSYTDRAGNTGTKLRTVKVVPPNTATTPVGNTTQSRLRHTATQLGNGRVLVVGGYSRTAEEYNPASRAFAAVGAPLFTHRGHTASLLQDGTVLVAGGAKPGSTGVEELYNPASGQWSRTGRMSTTRYDHAAVVLSNGRVLVTGGGTGESSGGALATAEIYDPATRQWSSAYPLNVARRNHTMTVIPGDFGGSVMVTGGFGADGAPLASTEVYTFEFQRWTWRQTSDLATARASHSATLLPDGSVLIVGGQTQDASRGATAERFNSSSYNWSFAGAMRTSRQNHTASLVNGKVLVTGGYNPQTGIQYSAEFYDPSSGWQNYSASLSRDRYKHTATSLDAKTVLFVGGFSNSDQNATTAELYSAP